MGFPTKNDHFGVFGGYHHLRKHPYITTYKTAFGKKINSSCQTAPKKKTPMMSQGYQIVSEFLELQIPCFQHWELLEAEKKNSFPDL